MALATGIREILLEGVVFKVISSIWNALKGQLGSQAGEMIQKRLNEKGRGLADEAVFGKLLAQASISKDKKNMIIDALQQLESADRVNGTCHARAFRMIIALDPSEGETAITTDKDDKKKIVQDPDYIHPGINILKLIGNICNNPQEAILLMGVVGAMQDAPFGTIDQFTRWLKTAGKQTIINNWQSVADYGDQLATRAEARRNDFKKSPVWKKLLGIRKETWLEKILNAHRARR